MKTGPPRGMRGRKHEYLSVCALLVLVACPLPLSRPLFPAIELVPSFPVGKLQEEFSFPPCGFQPYRVRVAANLRTALLFWAYFSRSLKVDPCLKYDLVGVQGRV